MGRGAVEPPVEAAHKKFEKFQCLREPRKFEGLPDRILAPAAGGWAAEILGKV